ncbi:hypothetical protein KN1_29610 [Stygiolobus caldivivus]|uniref:Uncharacterized protein n=1 Tax=Stygiolobus caldivivus TaxID=2824673 RepID=A0A8D5UAK7_9CREN|nr:hypothetical protein KN1_29610 [Stygiolobus caldivivus]
MNTNITVLNQGFSKYSRKEDVFADLVTVVKGTERVINTYFRQYEVKEVSQKIDELLKGLSGQSP